jgi:Kef-type K+ transport system membrane component KefB
MNQQVSGEPFSPGRGRTLTGYAAMILLAVAVLYLVHTLGRGLAAPPPSAVTIGRPKAGSTEILFHVLLALLAVVLTSRALGALFRRLRQPPVIGEVIAGIALGPSLLGALSPSVASYLLPASVAPYLGILSQLGVILFMFLVGLELDTSLLRDKPHAAVAISHASILAPFVLGVVLSLWLYPRLSNNSVDLDLFMTFMGVAMSVTAFPVLARILVDRGLSKTSLGVIAISCAAVDDVTAWCLLAVIASMADARAKGASTTIALTVAYVGMMLYVVRPLIAKYMSRLELRSDVSRGAVAVVLVALLLSALATEAIGVHAIFGAFLLGAVIPHDSKLARNLALKLEELVLILLLPAFFAFTGMRTQIGLVSGADQWLMCGAITAVACIGKIGGSFVAARFSGLSTREAASLGALMNTRGLMELVVLNLGLDLGIISPTLFAMMVLMAVVTTAATAPLLDLFQRTHS